MWPARAGMTLPAFWRVNPRIVPTRKVKKARTERLTATPSGGKAKRAVL